MDNCYLGLDSFQCMIYERIIFSNFVEYYWDIILGKM